MSTKTLFTFLLAAVACASPLEHVAREDEGCKPCAPSGAKNQSPPAVGPELSSMYTDLLESVKGIKFKRQEEDKSIVVRASGFCCVQGSECLNVKGLDVAMCYDKFTTNFNLADSSYGSITTGEYTAKDGSKANLISGGYELANGEKGQIYANESEKPNTATLSIPPQFTGTGVGSAIPASELGSIVVYTTTIPGSIFTAPTTLPASTVVTSVPGQSAPVTTTIPPKTITGATTIAPVTTVVTSTRSGASAAESSSSKGAAGHVDADLSVSLGMSIFTALMYAIYAL